MTKLGTCTGVRYIACTLSLLAISGWALFDTADAGDSTMSKGLKRKINVMEKVIDQVLEESPNLLIYSNNPTHGIYLEEFGAIFTFEASLVNKSASFGFALDKRFKDFELFNDIVVESDGDKVIVWRSMEDHEDDADDVEDDEAHTKRVEKLKKELGNSKSLKELREESEKHNRELYTKGKQELIETLVDYGATLTELDNDQWVAVAAFLKNSDYFRSNKISRLVLKVKVRDLRSYAGGALSQEDLVKRVKQEEY